MRVLQVASALHDWGGIERYVSFLSSGLQELGHETVVACPPNSPLDKNVSNSFPIATRRSKLKNFPTYLRLFRHQKFDIVHTHFGPDFLAAAYAAKLSKSTKVVMTRHVCLPWKATRVKSYLKLYDRIIPVSEAVQRKLAESGIPIDRMRVAKAGCPIPKLDQSPTAKDAISSMLGDSASSKIGFFGRFVKDKGTDLLPELASEFFKNGLELHLFGRGPEESALAGLMNHGFVNDVPPFMAAMQATLVPSQWEEAFPYSVLESFAVGTPVIGSDKGGIPELIAPGVTGWLCSSNEIASYVSAAQELKSQPKLAAEMGKNALQLHRSNYTIAHMSRRIEAVYEELLDRR